MLFPPSMRITWDNAWSANASANGSLDRALAQALDRVAAELRELVEEQHTVVRQGWRMSLEPGSLSEPTPAPRRGRATCRAHP
jgi:hypothetical protein